MVRLQSGPAGQPNRRSHARHAVQRADRRRDGLVVEHIAVGTENSQSLGGALYVAVHQQKSNRRESRKQRNGEPIPGREPIAP